MTRTVAMLAGGLGTRVAALTGGKAPKALLPIADRPFIDHKLAEAKRLGASDVVLLLGHGADAITEHVGDGAAFGLTVTIVLDGPELLGTGGALRRAFEMGALPDRVWVTYGDTLLDADLAAAERDADALGCTGSMTVLRNEDRWEPSNVSVADGRVLAYEKGAPPGTHDYIDYGYVMLPAAALLAIDEPAFDLGVAVRALIAQRQLAAFEVAERFHDIGTPERLAETDAWLRARANP